MMIKKEKKTEITYTRADVERILTEHAFTVVDSMSDKMISVIFECDDELFCNATVYVTEKQDV